MATVTDGSYVTRILGVLGERDVVEALSAGAEDFRQIVERLGPEGLARPWGEGKWTGAQVVAHLADCELGLGFRIRQVLAEERHPIQPFDQDAWARRYDEVDVAAACDAFLGARAWNLALVRRLGPAELAREAHHPERGPEPLEVVVRHLAGHTLHHLAQLRQIEVPAR